MHIDDGATNGVSVLSKDTRHVIKCNLFSTLTKEFLLDYLSFCGSGLYTFARPIFRQYSTLLSYGIWYKGYSFKIFR